MLDRNWKMLAVYSVIMCISMTLPIFGGSIVNTAMSRSLGWDATSLGLLVVSNMVAASVLLPLAAKLIGKFGVRSSMIVGFLSMAAGALALSTLVTRPTEAIFAYGIAMGITSAFSGVVQCQTGVAAWFPTRRTLAFSILYAGTGLVSFGLLSLVSYAISASGSWQSGWHVFLGAAATGIFMVLFLVREPAGTAETRGAAEEEGFGPPPGGVAVYPDRMVAQVFRMPLFWIIVFSMIAITAGSIFLAAHAQVYLLTRGYSPERAALSMSLLQIGMIFGNLGLGFIATRFELRRAMALALLSFAASFVLLANIGGMPLLVIFGILAGIGYGAGQVGSMALIGHYWDHKVFPMLTASALIAQTIGSAAAPVLAGSYYDKYGTYLPPIYTMVGLYLLVAVAIIFAGRERLSANGATDPQPV